MEQRFPLGQSCHFPNNSEALAMADVDIEILNAVNGEQLAVFTMNTSETLQQLYLRV